MNTQKPHDGKHGTLDQGLDELGRAYRDLGSDNPPDLLDQAILNRAHREVEKKAGWMQFGWLHGLTTAAVIVLAFSIVLQQREPIPVEEGLVPESSAPLIGSESRGSDRLQQAAPTAAMKLEAEEAVDSNLEIREYSEPNKERQLLEKVAGAPAAARAQEISLEEEAPTQRSRAKGLDVGETGFASVIAPQESEDEDALQDMTPAEQQLAKILRLKDADDESWKKELEDFLQQFPDYPLPAQLQD